MDGQEAAKTNLKGAIMLVIGAEGAGVSRLVKERSDFVVKIAVKGKIDSLNAAAAAAVLMYEKNQTGYDVRGVLWKNMQMKKCRCPPDRCGG